MKRPGEAATDAEHTLERAIAAIADWQGRAVCYGPVAGGTTNANFRVEVEGAPQAFFVKVPGRGTELFIDRTAAIAASRQAHALGLGPEVHHFLADDGVEIGSFIEGRRACTNGDFQEPDVRAAAVGAYRTFNDGPRLGFTKTIFDMIDEHVDQVRRFGGKLPEDFAWLDREYRHARAALEAAGLDMVPCFNDPIAGNFMLGPDRSIMLVDYEYASDNDRCYDLAVWTGEMFFPEDVEHQVIEQYFGRVEPRIVARIAVHRALADLKWATWAMVQKQTSQLEFDYYKYGAWKYMRARAVMHDWRWEERLRSL